LALVKPPPPVKAGVPKTLIALGPQSFHRHYKRQMAVRVLSITDYGYCVGNSFKKNVKYYGLCPTAGNNYFILITIDSYFSQKWSVDIIVLCTTVELVEPRF